MSTGGHVTNERDQGLASSPVGESDFGTLLRRYRYAAGLTQDELAERAALSARAISVLERGVRRSPYVSTARRLAEALGLGTADKDILLAAGRRNRRLTTIAISWRPKRLPAEPSPLIGRTEQVRAIRALLLEKPGRLVTLVGPAGVGKTRLAVAVAASLVEEFQGAVSFVDLAPLADPDHAPQAIASALGIVQMGTRSALQAVIDAIGDRQMLLVWITGSTC